MYRYLRLFRFGNSILGIVGVIVGAFIASGLGILEYWVSIVISCSIVFVFMAGGNALNDYIDRDIDLIAHPDRPIPRGEISPFVAKNLGVIFMILAVAIGVISQIASWHMDFLFWDSTSTAIVIIASLLMISYEVFLKQKGFVGNVTIAVLTGMLFLLGGAVCGNIGPVIPMAVMAVLVNIGREISKDIEDKDSDEGRITLPMKIGNRNASVIACMSFLAGVLLSALPLINGSMNIFYSVVFAADAMFIYAAFIVFKSAHKAQKTAKLAMAFALLAFVIGVI